LSNNIKLLIGAGTNKVQYVKKSRIWAKI